MAAWSLPRVQSAPPPTREGAEQRPLDPETIAVRLLLGVGDPQPQSWNGRVEVDQGEVVGVEGWRFRAGRRVTGPDAWEAQSLYLLKKAQAKAKAKGGKPAGDEGPGEGFARRPGAGRLAVVPTGVIVRLKAPADATLTVATEQGDADDPARRPRRRRRAALPRRPGRGPARAGLRPAGRRARREDFPAAAADGQGGAWVAYVDHTPPRARGRSSR